MTKLNMSLKQMQTLKMTPQLQQAIRMLQMSRLELEGAIREEIEKNPLLEEGLESDASSAQSSHLEKQESEANSKAPDADPEKQQGDFDWDSYFDRDFKRNLQSFSGNDELSHYENVISTQQSLHEYLRWQVKMSTLDDTSQALAEMIIDYIEEDGYLTISLEEMAQTESVDLELLESVLLEVQTFDPPGVGARNLKECLLVQAKVLEEDTTDLVTLITNHLSQIERKQYDQIAKAMSKDVLEIKELVEIISSMDPKPGRAYAPQDTQYVLPDVYVYKVGDEYIVSLNEDGLPKLKVSQFYKTVMQQSGKENKTTGAKETHDYIQEKLKSAVWLIKSMHQRQKTIYRVTEAIVKHQKDFLDKGPSALRPLILKDIAGEVGIHESTVSRVTSNKYVHTPQGIFELKYFFNSGISTSDGDGMASESVRLRIKALIEQEDSRRPLSDQDLVDKLKIEGIQMARRTVAKYRESLKILPSSRRKQA
jgi:RNA polymerase sigma-54 factor